MGPMHSANNTCGAIRSPGNTRFNMSRVHRWRSESWVRRRVVLWLGCCVLVGGCGGSSDSGKASNQACSSPIPTSYLAATLPDGVALVDQAGQHSVVPGSNGAYASAVAISRDRCRVAFAME